MYVCKNWIQSRILEGKRFDVLLDKQGFQSITAENQDSYVTILKNSLKASALGIVITQSMETKHLGNLYGCSNMMSISLSERKGKEAYIMMF